MNYLVHKLTLDMHKTISQASLSVPKGDTKRKLHITLTEKGKVYPIDDGCSVVFYADKDNDDELFNTCTVENGVIVYEFTELTANIPCKMDCEVRLYDVDNSLVTSPRFTIIVEGVKNKNSKVEASDEFSALTKLYSDTKEVYNNIASLKVDDALSLTSTNPVQNQAITREFTKAYNEVDGVRQLANDVGSLAQNVNQRIASEIVPRIKTLELGGESYTIHESADHSIAVSDENGNVVVAIKPNGEKVGFGGGGGASVDETIDFCKCGLPVLALDGDTSAMTKENEVSLTYTLKTRKGYALHTGTCTCKWQGSSSVRRGYPKRNYTIKFDTEFEATGVIVSADGVTAPTPWGAQKKYCMKANWIDPSAARNVVNAKLWGQVVATRDNIHEKLAASPNYGAIDGFPVIILINGEFEGLYTFNIPKDDWLFNMGDGESEYIVCGESNSMAACGFREEATFIEGDNQANTDFAIEYKPDGVEDATVIESFNEAIRAAMNAPNSAEWESVVAPYFDVDSAIDYYIFTCCISGVDNLRKNILYGTYDGTKWFMSAYDLDTTMGSNPYGTAVYKAKTSATQFYEGNARHRLFELIYNRSKDKLKARYKELRGSVLSDENVWYMYNNFVCPISRAVYNADAQKWGDKIDTDDGLPMPATTTANVENYMQYYRMHCALLDKEME